MNEWLKTYQKGCIKKLKDRKRIFGNRIDDVKEEIEYNGRETPDFFDTNFEKELYKRLETLINSVVATKKTLKILSEKENKILEKQFTKIKLHPKINKVEVKSSDELCIKTKKFKVSGYDIGNFKIIIKQSNPLEIRNLEYRVGVYDHWHIEGGNPCLGEWSELLSKYFHTGNIFLFVDTIIHYLLAPGDEHPYIKKNIWLNHFKKRTKPETASPIYTPMTQAMDNGSTTTTTSSESWSIAINWY